MLSNVAQKNCKNSARQSFWKLSESALRSSESSARLSFWSMSDSSKAQVTSELLVLGKIL
jgi:hypothetical protein